MYKLGEKKDIEVNPQSTETNVERTVIQDHLKTDKQIIMAQKK